MQNIKKILLYSAFIFSVKMCHCSEPVFPGIGVKAVNAGGVVVNGILEKHLPKVGEIVVNASANIGVEATKIAAPALTDASAKLGVEAANAFAPAATILAGAYAATQVYSMGKDITQTVRWYFWPTAS